LLLIIYLFYVTFRKNVYNFAVNSDNLHVVLNCVHTPVIRADNYICVMLV